VFFVLEPIHPGKLYYPIDSAIDIPPFSRHRSVLLWFSPDFAHQTKSPKSFPTSMTDEDKKGCASWRGVEAGIILLC